MPQERSIWDGIYEAVSDIREKVAEEPWWGRVVTERGELPQGLEQKEAEPQQGLNGEILDRESQPAHVSDNAGHLEHGFVLDGQPVNAESSPHWSGARQALTHNEEPNRDRQLEIGLDR